MRLISHSLTPELILSGILSLISVGSLSAPRLVSALPPVNIYEASPKAISGRTSYIRVRLEFLRYPQVIRQLFQRGSVRSSIKFYLNFNLLMDRSPGFGSIIRNSRALHTRFPCGSGTEYLNLAAYNNSPDRSTKSTTSHLNVLCVLVNIRFQVLFHSPPGVLFTFPSQYFSTIGHQVVFRLGGWAPRLLTGFHVSADTLDTANRSSHFAYKILTFFDWASHPIRL